MLTAKTTVQCQMNENKEFERHLDWANEVRRNAAIRMTSYQQRVIAHYNKKSRPPVFPTRTLVLKRVFDNMTKIETEKL